MREGAPGGGAPCAWIQGQQRGGDAKVAVGAMIRVVLVETTHPGNIGAAARAMKAMGLSRLCLVNPARFPHAEATARASGADDLLVAAEVHESLASAIAGCRLVVGASARRRRLACPELDPRQCAERAVAEAAFGEVAVVFGRERNGLTNQELDLCHHLVHIPTVPDFASLNVASAVQLVAWEIREAVLRADAPPAGVEEEDDLPDAGEMERFYAHLEEVLVEIEFLDPNNPRHLMRRLRRLYNRARPDRTELNILRGILTAVQRRAK